MSTKGVADIVFCLDASGSMAPCFQGVRGHITDFLDGLQSNPQFTWDWRIDFLAHSATEAGGGCSWTMRSVRHGDFDFIRALYHGQSSEDFFTTNVAEFKRGLSRVRVRGDETPLVALDCCLDYPWRKAANCHRVVIMMTDEPFETGAWLREQRAKLPALIEKIQGLRVMLFIVAPESPAFDELAAVEKSVYEVVDRSGDGLARVDFRAVLLEIGKSVSVSLSQMPEPEKVPRAVFGQASWTRGGYVAARDGGG
jgi:hypothetical protein